MSLFELAALIGLLLAGVVIVLTALDARRDARAGAEEAKAAADRIALAEERILRMESRVQGLHDCVRQAVPTCPYAGPSSVSFDLPKVLDPEGRTGEVK